MKKDVRKYFFYDFHETNNVTKTSYVVCVYLIILCSHIFFSSCQKDNEVVGINLPEDNCFVSILDSTAIIYNQGKESKYIVEVNNNTENGQPLFNLQKTDKETGKSFSQFIEDNRHEIEKARINLALYDGNTNNYLDLVAILNRLSIYKYTRLSQVIKILGFYESTKYNGLSIIEYDNRYAIFDYESGVSEVLEAGDNRVENSIAKEKNRHITISKDLYITHLVSSAFLIKNPDFQYLLLNNSDFGIWLFEFDVEPLATCLISNSSSIPVINSFEIKDKEDASLFIGQELPYEDGLTFINKHPNINSMSEIRLYSHLLTEEFVSQRPLKLVIDENSHIKIVNNQNLTLGLNEFVDDVDDKYLITKTIYHIDKDLVYPKLLMILGLLLLYLLDWGISYYGKKIIKTKKLNIVLFVRKLYIAWRFIFIVLFLVLLCFACFSVNSNYYIEAAYGCFLVKEIIRFIKEQWHPVSLKTRIPNGQFSLYLRGFRQDDYNPLVDYLKKSISFETELCDRVKKHTRRIYAIGMTKELYSPFGAKRLYFSDNEWKEKMKQLAGTSRLVIINIHNSESCIYEIRECKKWDYKVICIIEDHIQYDEVRLHLDFMMPDVPNDGNIYFFRLNSLVFQNYGEKEQFHNAIEKCLHAEMENQE